MQLLAWVDRKNRRIIRGDVNCPPSRLLPRSEVGIFMRRDKTLFSIRIGTRDAPPEQL